jgi:hypothetical protein
VGLFLSCRIEIRIFLKQKSESLSQKRSTEGRAARNKDVTFQLSSHVPEREKTFRMHTYLHTAQNVPMLVL